MSKRVGTQLILYGWKEIAEYFPYHYVTVYNKYGQEMLEAGFVFKTLSGSDSNPHKKVWRIFSFESMVLSFISKKQAQQGFI